jgi:hypothetical protein
MASKLDRNFIDLHGSTELPLEPTPRDLEMADDDEFHPSLSTEMTRWKFKHGLMTNDVSVKNDLDQRVQEIKVKGILHPELIVTDSDGRCIATLKVPSLGGKAKVYFEKNVVYATIKNTSVLRHHWTIVTTEKDSEEIKVNCTSAFNTHFEFTRHGQMILKCHTKFRTSKLEVSAGEDVPLLLLCAAYVDLRLRGQI